MPHGKAGQRREETAPAVVIADQDRRHTEYQRAQEPKVIVATAQQQIRRRQKLERAAGSHAFQVQRDHRERRNHQDHNSADERHVRARPPGLLAEKVARRQEKEGHGPSAREANCGLQGRREHRKVTRRVADMQGNHRTCCEQAKDVDPVHALVQDFSLGAHVEK
jgi:hypothetical protein